MFDSIEAVVMGGKSQTYTSIGVRAPCVTEQQTAPAKANLEYSAIPLSFSGVLERAVWTTASTLVEPVEVDGEAIVSYVYAGDNERSGRVEIEKDESLRKEFG